LNGPAGPQRAGQAAPRNELAGGGHSPSPRSVVSALARLQPPVLEEPLVEPTVAVNREELGTRIAGTNLALRALEAEMDRRAAWPLGQVAAFTGRLKALAVRVHDLRLFLDLIDESDRRLMEPLQSPLPVVGQLQRQIVGARRRIAPDDRSHDALARREILDHLQGELGSIRELLDGAVIAGG
ncbi:MAG: hypothetical protein ACOC46_01020, partial [Pirellulales bacterium]